MSIWQLAASWLLLNLLPYAIFAVIALGFVTAAHYLGGETKRRL